MADHLEFQILDWNSYHRVNTEDVDIYTVQLFGRTQNGKDVCLKVNNFTPFFYVLLPDNWTMVHARRLIRAVQEKVKYSVEHNPKCEYEYDVVSCLTKYTIVQKKPFYGFRNGKICNFLMMVFSNMTAYQQYSWTFSREIKVDGCSKPMMFPRYESSIEPHIRLMHIKELESCGWIKIDKKHLKRIKDYSNCDHSYQTNWKHIEYVDSRNRMAPLIIGGYDLEVKSSDDSFPQADRPGDKIVQAGIVLYRLNEIKPFDQHILVLGECDEIEGATVECYKTEEGLILGWARKLSELRPDIIMGWNNKGFDDKYIYDRICLLDELAANKKKTTVDNLENSLMRRFLMTLGKLNNKYLEDYEGVPKSLSEYCIKPLSSSALGDNFLHYFHIPGIITIDMMKVVQRDHRLDSYKLDSVAANFIKESIIGFSVKMDEDTMVEMEIKSNSINALESGAYIQIMVNDGYSVSPLKDGVKHKVRGIELRTDGDNKHYVIKIKYPAADLELLREAEANKTLEIFWTFAKDDMHHTLINKYFREGNVKGITKVAIYCLKDCVLPCRLAESLKIIVNNIGMAVVCNVPLSYLFLRGQGVKGFSLVSKKCRQKGFLIPTRQIKKTDLTDDPDETYEGATVIRPKPDVYTSPIGVLDYSSLYPSSICEINGSHECYIDDDRYENVPGYVYHDIEGVKKDGKGKVIRNLDGTPKRFHHRFAQELMKEEIIEEEMKETFQKVRENNLKLIEEIEGEISVELLERIDQKVGKIKEINLPDLIASAKNNEKIILKKAEIKLLQDMIREKIPIEIEIEKKKKYNIVNGQYVRYGVIPEILTELLNKRKITNALLDKEKDPFKKAVLNSLQLAYKITANSLYGLMGASTSPVGLLPIAESTTAIGRKRLHFAKQVVEEVFPGSEIIYGDTDSIFINFHLKDADGNDRTDRSALIDTIKLCKKAAAEINSRVPKPQGIVYEKTYLPFILVAKKKYVGLLYQKNPDKYYMKAMGIVLKRRDNAPIVKIVVGGIIETILKTKDVDLAIKHTKIVLAKLMKGEYGIDKFIVSKNLKNTYKNPQSIVHKVLADRMAVRDPGNRPQIGDRIPFVYVVRNFPKKKGVKILQGEYVEHPTYVIENGLQIDYLHYLENQIINPASQVLELLMMKSEVKRFFDRYIDREHAKRAGTRSLEDWLPEDQHALGENRTYQKRKKHEILDNLRFIGTTKRIEKKSMEEWASRVSISPTELKIAQRKKEADIKTDSTEKTKTKIVSRSLKDWMGKRPDNIEEDD
jgi:DNA polymerase elongation subunit (family B)